MNYFSCYVLRITCYLPVQQTGGLRSPQRGDIAVYLSLIMVSIMLSAAVLFSLILAKQIRSTEDAVASERAFYAANTGLEQGLYQIAKEFQEPNVIVPLAGEIQYGTGDVARYEGNAQVSAEGAPCVVVTGRYRTSQRRLRFGAPNCLPE